MDDFRALGIFDVTQLCDLSLCRLCLKVTTLPGASSGPGKRASQAMPSKHKSSQTTTHLGFDGLDNHFSS